MKDIKRIEERLPETGREIRQNGGFITEGNLADMTNDQETRLIPVLVRCGGGRFVCPAQNAKHFIEIIERDAKANEDGDYIRDVSLPA